MFAGRQSTDCIQQIRTSQLFRFGSSPSANQLSQNRSTNERWRAAVREVAGRFDPTILYDQSESEAIAANWIRLFCNRGSLREFSGIARMREILFECGGIGHGLERIKKQMTLFLFDLCQSVAYSGATASVTAQPPLLRSQPHNPPQLQYYPSRN